MTDLLEKAWSEVGKLAPEDQDEVAGVMLQMIDQRRGQSILTDEQRAELQRRLNSPSRIFVPMEEAFARLDRFWQDR